jgi:hypothetical protein
MIRSLSEMASWHEGDKVWNVKKRADHDHGGYPEAERVKLCKLKSNDINSRKIKDATIEIKKWSGSGAANS